MLLNRRILFAILLLVSAMPMWAQDGPQKLPSVALNAGMHNIQAELAQTPDQRNMRPKWVEAFLGSLVNWEFAQTNFA